MLGDVNISAILDSFSISYDKRVRPNYGGKNERFSLERLMFKHQILDKIFLLICFIQEIQPSNQNQ